MVLNPVELVCLDMNSLAQIHPGNERCWNDPPPGAPGALQALAVPPVGCCRTWSTWPSHVLKIYQDRTNGSWDVLVRAT